MSEQTNVLVVEDNELDRALLDAHLSREGFATEFARDGLEAWSMLDGHPDRFDLVLLDRSDRGNGFAWSRYLDIDPRRAFDRHGRGILMARHVSLSWGRRLSTSNRVSTIQVRV